MPVKIRASIDRVSLNPGDSLKVRWTRDTGELLYPHLDDGRTKYRDDYVVLVRTQDHKDGLHIFVRAHSKIKIHKLVE